MLDALKNLWESFSLKIKLIAGAIFGLFGFFAIIFISKKINAKQILELELKNLEERIKIKQTEEDISTNNSEIIELEKKASIIKQEIEDINSGKKSEFVTKEELDSFFDSRGF
tara:strand:+ start:827 stop:1165 length:339 start_codon:yes stop_codon:yes gene_type:complete